MQNGRSGVDKDIGAAVENKKREKERDRKFLAGFLFRQHPSPSSGEDDWGLGVENALRVLSSAPIIARYSLFCHLVTF